MILECCVGNLHGKMARFIIAYTTQICEQEMGLKIAHLIFSGLVRSINFATQKSEKEQFQIL